VLEAMILLLDRRLHHLALKRNGEVIGVVTHSDLLRHQMRSPGFVLRRILRGHDPESPGTHPIEIAAMVEGLHRSGLATRDIARLVATVNDALVERILREAEAECGAPPCAYAWIVFGSEGRREQLLLTDQDNALVYEVASDGARHYFERLAHRTVEGLVRAGIPACQGGFMATQWCHPLARWKTLFASWIEQPDPQALMDVTNLFDFCALHGTLDLEPLEAIIASARDNRTFLGQLARASLRMRPPLGLFHRIRQGNAGIDLKSGGLVPIVGLARVLALESGARERSTLGRLVVARSAGRLSAEGADLLTEGFGFLMDLRLREQLRALREGRDASNHVRLEALGRVDARHLKEIFLEIRHVQQAMAQRYQVELLA
jgi:CBS domain-containing protein